MIRPPGCLSDVCAVQVPNHKSCDPMEFLDFRENTLWLNLLLLLLLAVLGRVVALVIVAYKTRDVKVPYRAVPPE